MEESPSTSSLALVSADTLQCICGYLSPIDLLAIACTNKSMLLIANEVLSHMRAVQLANTNVSPSLLAWLLKQRLSGVESIDVTGCPCLNKATVLRVLRSVRDLSALAVRDVGLGSWTVPNLRKLLTAAPPALQSGVIEADARCVLHHSDMRDASELAAPGGRRALRVRRLVVVKGLAAMRTCLLYTSPSPRDS